VKNLAKFLLLSILAWPAFAQTPCSPLPDVGACSASGGNNCPKLNGFVPFPGTNLWNLNIATAPVDPESATIASASGFAGEHLHHDFGSTFGYPIEVVDSSQTPASTVIQLQAHGNQSDNVIAPIPLTVPIEGNPAPGTGCPATNAGDAHTHTLDRHTCTIYSTYNTHLCGTVPNQFLTADQLTAWDARNYEKRPYGWTSEDVSGSSMYAGIIKYDEVAACAAGGPVPPHAIRFTLPNTMNDSNNGFFVFPATHAAGTLWNSYNVIGMKIRLSSTFNLSGYSPINKCILEEMQQYGLILADNGSSFYFQGEPDPRWNDADLENLDSIQSSNFDVVTMDPGWPGYDSATAPTGASPIINSFTASVSSVSSGSPVTFTYDVSGDSYDFIDLAGVGTSGSGSVTASPTVTTTYTLISTNQYGRTTSTPITITVPGSVIGTPMFTPAGGTYASAQTISITDSTPGATIYYTTDGSTPTTHSTVYTAPISVSVSQTINALATAPGYSNPSAVGSAAYSIGSSVVATPAFSPAAGTYSSTQTVTISTTTPSATIYYTTNGSTPTTSSTVYAGPITVSSTETLQAVAVASGYSTSAVGSAAYTIGKPMLNTLLSVALVAHVAGGSGTTSAVNMTGANFIAICATDGYGMPSTPTDSSGNTYVIGYSPQLSTPGALFVAYSPTVTSSMTFSIGGGGTIAVAGFSGIAGGPDKTAALGIPGSSSSGTLTVPSVTPTNANELVLGCYYENDGGGGTTPPTVTPVTLLDRQASTVNPGYAYVASAYQIQTTAAAVSTVWTIGAANGSTGQTATFYSVESPAPLVITSTAVPEGFVSTAYSSTGSLYSNQLTATGGVQPYVWTKTSGTLPTGLSMSSGGLITGTPTGAVSARSITYEVTDAQSNTATVTLPITIAATAFSGGAGTCPGSNVSPYSGFPYHGVQKTAYQGCTLSASGGTTPYAFSYSTNVVPDYSGYGYYATPPEGLTLNSSTGALTGTVYGQGAYITQYTITDAVGTIKRLVVDIDIAGNNTFAANLFPSNSAFHIKVTSLPVDTFPAAQIPSSVSGRGINAGFGFEPQYTLVPFGIPILTVPSTQAIVPVDSLAGYQTPYFTSGPWPSYAPIEGTQNNSNPDGSNGGDGHSLIVQLDSSGNPASLWEMWQSAYRGTSILGWYDSTNAYWPNVTSTGTGAYAMLAQGQGSADAAGLPVAPLLVNADEVIGTGTPSAPNGVIKHPIRITMSNSVILQRYVWPATAAGGGGGSCSGGYFDPTYSGQLSQLNPPTGGCMGGRMPYGEIYRLKSTVTNPVCAATSPQASVIIQGLRDYGFIVSDGGITGALIGTPDARWKDTDLGCLSSLTMGNFEPVEVQQLAVSWPTSSQTTIGPPTAVTPTFSPAAGAYSSAQTVTISTTTPSATIYYTTNGSTPTTSSTVYAGPITVAATETLNAIDVTAGNSANPVGSAAYTITAPTLQSITVTPGSTSVAVGNSQQFKATGTFSDSSTSDLTTAVKWSSTNTATAAVNSAGLATAMAQGSANIVVTSGRIQAQAAVTILPAATVTFSPAAGTYTSAQSVTISTATPSATIYYTTNGSTPTTSSAMYAGSITVSSTETVQAIAVASGSTSTAGSATYTINLPAATVTFSPAGGTYTSAQPVTIGTTTPSATIYYTTNGSTPTTSSAVYSGPVTVSSTETVQAIAIASGYSTSAAGSAAYTINLPAATPTFSPAGGTYTSAQSVTLGTTTPSATIYYTTNGSTPTTSSAVYTGSITVSSTETIKAIAVASGYSTSAAGSATYTINLPAATPTFSPAGGTYTSAQSVTIGTTTPSATIYYTTNGSVPTTSSAVYAGSITVSSTETINAIAVASGYSTSAAGSASYTINLPAATPTFSPAGGTYASAQPVTIGTATPSATIYYTTNGSTPTTSSAVYTGSIAVSSTETVQAIAVASGNSTSAAGSATYTISLPAATPTFSPAGGTYASAQSVTIGTTTPSATIYYTTNGSVPTTSSAVYTGSIAVSSTETVQAIAVASGNSTSAAGSATYTISLPAATPTFSPAGGTYASAQSVTIGTTTPSATIYYTTNGSVPTTSSAVYTGSIAVSSTETVQAIAVASGNSTGAAGSATYTISLPAAATPTVSPAGGTYTSAQTVNLSASHWSTIYYTTNGSTPTTSSAVYTGSITVSSTETINAIAVASGYSTSAVASASFTIGQLAASPSFSVDVSPASLTIAAGTSGTTTVLVTPQNGFAAETSLTCAGLPSWASCTFSPSTVTPSGSIASSTLTITTTPVQQASRSGSSALFPGSALAISLCCFGWRKRRGLQMLVLAVAILGAGLCTGCGANTTSPVQATVSIIAAHGDLAPNTNLTLTIM
jgi:hypothetical protein